MGLSVRTAHGKDFQRCGIKFGKEPVLVPNEKLREPFGSRKVGKCIGDVLTQDNMLVCVNAPDPVEPEAEKPEAADKGKKPEKTK